MVRLLQARNYGLIVIDQSERVIQQLRDLGIPYLYGNAASRLVLEKANIRQAEAMVITMSDPMSTRLCLKRALDLCPDLDIVVRAPRKEDIEQLYQLGASEVVQPEFEASLGLCSHLLRELGEPLSLIQQEIMDIRDSHYTDLRPGPPSCLLRPTPHLAAAEALDLAAANLEFRSEDADAPAEKLTHAQEDPPLAGLSTLAPFWWETWKSRDIKLEEVSIPVHPYAS
jgi:CPA2 family monovalent cation:H+ antiporter-2